jgi:septal ring-binding cell division protein DamX
MEFVTDIKRSYRRYRLYNKAAHPLTIWLIDGVFLLLRILVLLMFLAIIYLLLRTTPLGPLGKLFGDNDDATAVVSESTTSNNVQRGGSTITATSTPAASATTPQPAAVTAQPASQITRLNSSSSPEILGPGWLMEQSVGDYTIQFSSASDMDRLIEFANQFSNSDQVTIYPFQVRDGRTVYGLASGIYPDFASARQAIEQMPEALRKEQPWIRAVDTLQSEISALRAQ